MISVSFENLNPKPQTFTRNDLNYLLMGLLYSSGSVTRKLSLQPGTLANVTKWRRSQNLAINCVQWASSASLHPRLINNYQGIKQVFGCGIRGSTRAFTVSYIPSSLFHFLFWYSLISQARLEFAILLTQPPGMLGSQVCTMTPG